MRGVNNQIVPGNSRIKTVTIGLLIVLLLGAIGYIGYVQYGKYKSGKQMTGFASFEEGPQYESFKQGAQYGYEQAVGQLYQEALKCQPVPVTFDNQTINMIAVECPVIQELIKKQTPSN